ncbi:unnamed protein product [Adineta ricciae]|uniref:Uncharacterized protein n=2 Tax=Adineta ricciae TaxID=249248 RepID=A0A814JSR2_ADIRI|nr:unnamed protein product [Adineta ricciae]
MKRSIIINNSNEKNQINDNPKRVRKRSLEDNGCMKKSKKRRHISPQHENHLKISLSPKKTSKKRSLINNTFLSTKNNSHTTRKSSSRRQPFSTEHFVDITLPNWECISPNIDQILSNKHTQSGVFAHEVHLVQQELEALLSMSIVREDFLKDLLHPMKPINNESLRSKIRQHQQAEYIYSSKKVPKKPLPSLTNQLQARHYQPNLLLDRQVSMAPIIGARIDKIWSDINTYFRKTSSNDLLILRNLIEFHQLLEEKLEQYRTDYQNQVLTPANITEQLNEENFHELDNITELNPLVTHYVERTTMGRFQRKLYDRVPHNSPVYKTPISSPFYRKSITNGLDINSSVRSSPRLHPNLRIDASNVKSSDDMDPLRSKIKGRTTPTSPPSPAVPFHERVQTVHDYLTDQHPLEKRQLFNEHRSTRKRKASLTMSNDQCTDTFESKLSALISLLHESSAIISSALTRARVQSSNEQTWQKLTNIEHELETLIQKVDSALTGGSDNSNSINLEKTFQTSSNQ